MNVVILHGIFGRAGENWGQWLSDALKVRGYSISMPSLPDADHPDRTAWLAAVKECAGAFDPQSLIIVGHSLGVTSALDYIEQTPAKIKALVSVSGFAEDYGSELNSYFLSEKPINFHSVLDNLEQAFALYGDDDPYVTQAALQSLARNLHTVPAVIKNGGHLNETAGFSTFPALLNILVSIQ